MNLSALQVTLQPEQEPQFLQLLEGLDWAEAYHREAGRMIVIIESESLEEDSAHMRELQRVEGVITVDLVEYRLAP